MSNAVRQVVGSEPASLDVSVRPQRRISPLQLWWSFVIALELAFITVILIGSTTMPHLGLDYQIHVQAAQRLLDTGSPYQPFQLQGPYTIWTQPMPILYPPVAFVLFVPFIWLPPVLWWAIPFAIVVGSMSRHRPPLWAWAATLACFCTLQSLSVIAFGNPGIWICAFMAAGTVLSWPFALTLIKPTFAPLAILGIRHRSWWMTVAVMAVVSLLFGRLWLDWITVIRNSDLSLVYNLPTLPLMVAPLIPWLADPRHPIHGRLRELRGTARNRAA